MGPDESIRRPGHPGAWGLHAPVDLYWLPLGAGGHVVRLTAGYTTNHLPPGVVQWRTGEEDVSGARGR